MLKKNIFLFNHKKDLQRYIDVKKTINFYVSSYTKDGYFYFKSPMLQTSYPFIGILHSIKKSPSLNTINFVKSCQVGIEFAEIPGETPWWAWTRMALEILNWLNLSPRNKNNIIKFYQKFQNKDGGFGSIRNEKSNIRDTFMMIDILYQLNSEPRNVHKVMKWIKSHVIISNTYLLYNYVSSLINLKHRFSFKEKQKLKKIACDFLDKNNFQSIYFCLKTLKLLNLDISDFEILLTELKSNLILNNSIYNNPYDIFYISRTFNLFNKSDREVNSILYNYAKSYELKNGGFSEKHPSVMKNVFTYLSLFYLGAHDRIDSTKFLNWLENEIQDISWDRIFIDLQYVLLIYKLMGFNSSLSRENILKIIDKEVNYILKNHEENYRTLRHIKGIFEIWSLLEVPIKLMTVKKLIKKILIFYNDDGGFGHKKFSYMYAAYWAMSSINTANEIIDLKITSHHNHLLKIEKKVCKWINLCYNDDGGFGSMPSQPSTLQTTYLALRSLMILKQKPKNIKKTIKYVLNHQNKDGGLCCKMNSFVDLVCSLYAIKSLIILNQLKKM